MTGFYLQLDLLFHAPANCYGAEGSVLYADRYEILRETKRPWRSKLEIMQHNTVPGSACLPLVGPPFIAVCPGLIPLPSPPSSRLCGFGSAFERDAENEKSTHLPPDRHLWCKERQERGHWYLYGDVVRM
jgi:hypothetical protein